MKTYIYLFLSLCLFLVQDTYAKALDIKSENTAKVYLDVLENGFPEMEIKLYTGNEPSDGIFSRGTNYQFIVQPKATVVGFDSKSFNFSWFFPGGVTPFVRLEGCGIKVGTFIPQAPVSGEYTLTVQIWDGAGHTIIVERKLVFA